MRRGARVLDCFHQHRLAGVEQSRKLFRSRGNGMALIGCLDYEKLRAFFGKHFPDGGYPGSFGCKANSFYVVPDPIYSHGIVGRQLKGYETLRGIHRHRLNAAQAFQLGIKPRDAGNAVHPLDGHIDRQELSLRGQAKAKEQS